MASPTPAAPAAPSAAPQGAPGGPSSDVPAGSPTPTGDSAADIAADARAPRLAKPLKPIPSLPGVYADEDPFPAPPSSKSDNPSRPDATPSRGPDGRFVASSSAATPDDGAPPATPTDPKPTPAKFRVGDIEFDSEEHAAQNYKSLRGQFRPLQSLAKEFGGLDKIEGVVRRSAESARGWHAEATRLQAEIDALRSGAPAAAVPDAASTAPNAANEADIDWALYAEIKKLANESGEPWQAEKWLMEEVQKRSDARWQKRLDERFAPVDDATHAQEFVAQTETLFANLAEYTNADGSPAFPELNNDQEAREIGRIWHNLGFPPELALTPKGAIAAIALHHMAKSRSQARTTSPSPTPAAPLPPPAPTDANAAAMLDGGRPSTLGTGTDGAATHSAEAARILGALRQANTGSRSMLGFDA